MLAAVLLTALGATARAKETPANDCLIGVENEAEQQLSGTINCTDGDPSCDADGATNGSCSFKIRGCLNIPDVAGCTLRPIKKVKFVTPHSNNKIVVTPVAGQASSVCGSFIELQTPLKKKGKKPGKRFVNASVKADVKPAGKNKDKDKVAFVCNPCPSASCVPPTTTTTTIPSSATTTITPSTSSTTTTTNLPGTILDFTTGAAGGTCGSVKDGSDAVLLDLTCGNLYLGGGNTGVPPNTTPDGATNRFALDCTGDSCTVGATSTAPAPVSADVDCTNTDCFFGTPLPIPSASPTCVINTFAAPAGGTLDLATGVASLTVALNSATYISSNAAHPCPQCSGTGTPSSPGTGTCNRGPRATLACTSTNSDGLTRDCPPGAPSEGIVGTLAVNLSPLTTGGSSKTDPAGNFCPGQDTGGTPGCFHNGNCRTITETGIPAGPLAIDTPASVALASVFCVPETGNAVIDIVGDLPGPGATAIPGKFVVH
jgi:hypothetical protein